jgi:hypothetical protein
MNGTFQFSLRQILLVITLVAACLGTSKWCYVKYADRIRPLTRDWELQLYVGNRVSLEGRFQYVGGSSPFQIVWFGERKTPIAVKCAYADGSPLPGILDGAPVVVTGRLTTPPSGAEFPVPVMCRDWRSGYLVYDGRRTPAIQSTPYSIAAEEVRQIAE